MFFCNIISAIIPQLAIPAKRSQIKAQSAHPHVVNLEICRTALYQNSFLHRTGKLWNSLPKGVSPREHAFESSQKYKEGKFIIELAHMIKENGWD
ncbi:unnamed protein product [Phaedon cochleariae]|uniref:Uncharacterized protein n=1 Tax=Phaedon cochleariae TaxID=80249 RepID=A0A9N9X040_PHACE|nr:unnamed protein product [Phaedon cochleariae]